MQCVANSERRRCIVRRAGYASLIEDLTGFYVSGVYCSEKLRSNGIATRMMFRLLGNPTESSDALQGLPFAKIYDDNDQYLPLAYVMIFRETWLILRYRKNACFFGLGEHAIYNKLVSEVVTPGICRIGFPFREDKTLDLPASIQAVDTSTVRFLTIKDTPRILERYEQLLRTELEQPADIDRFVAVPEGKFHSCNLDGESSCQLILHSWAF